MSGNKRRHIPAVFRLAALLLAVGTPAGILVDRAMSNALLTAIEPRAVGLLHTAQKCTVVCTALSVSSLRAAFPNPTQVVDDFRQSTALCKHVIDQ